jgi:LysM repeat protein
MTTNTASSQNARLCPTCGTRLSENATRCQVCGTVLNPAAGSNSAAKTVQGSRMPEITLTLPAALGLLALFVTIGAVLVYFVLHNLGGKTTPGTAITATATITPTPTASVPPTMTLTPTLEMTATPLPPKSYVVASGDTCLRIASLHGLAMDQPAINAIIQANPGVIDSACDNLVAGRTISVPQPTPTATAAPSQAAGSGTPAASGTKCASTDYVVKEGDTLGSIAANYAVAQKDIKEFNGMLDDNVMLGEPLKIPLCHRTTDPTATPTNPPPYPPANLLLPADGAFYTVANDTITLQWSQVGELRPNESYAVTIEDITEGKGRKLVDYVTDTKYIIPASFRPTDTTPHVLRWSVLPVRQSGMTKDNQPIWEPAGTVSATRDFTWSGAPVAAPTATP